MSRAHQCTHPGGCDSEARWALDLRFWTVGLGAFRHEVKCHSTIRVCGRHTQPAVTRLMAPPNRERMARWMLQQNLPIPDFGSFEITWNRVDHDEIEAEVVNEAASAEVEEQLRQ